MSATPETDAKVSAHIGFFSCATVPAELCRRLERERDEAREAFVIATDQMVIAQGKVREVGRERDEARAAMREAWLAMDEIDGTDRMVKWQNKHANI
jgi:predicted house-cleaning NTP pyrophosphatase (Maf/HAM1 superfamily)